MTAVDWALVGVGVLAATVGLGCLAWAVGIVWRATDDDDPKGLR